MLVVPDADEPYCPLPRSVLAALKPCRAQADSLLDQIPRIYAGTNHLDSCGTAAIEACILALKVRDTLSLGLSPTSSQTSLVT